MAEIACMCPECDNYEDGSCMLDTVEIQCGMCEGYSTDQIDAKTRRRYLGRDIHVLTISKI